MIPTSIIIAGAVVLFMVIIGVVLAKMYTVTKGDSAMVVNGLGSKPRVIKDGGGIVISGFQTTRRVPLDNMKILVERSGKEALLTQDKMRVDLKGAFYLKVKPDTESIITASQTLGDKLLDTDLLKSELEDKFVGALRAAAEKITMSDMQTNRKQFVQQVQDNINSDLSKNGIELETFSPTHLDQTDTRHLDPNNVNDAEALRKITEITELKKKEKNAIEQETAVSIARRNQEANKNQLDIKKADEMAKLEQEQSLAEATSKQAAIVANAEAEAVRVKEETRIRTEQEIQEQEVQAQLALEAKRIESDKAQELQRVESEREVAIQEEQKRKDIEVAEQNRRKAQEIAEQERKIAIAEKQEETSKAEAAANLAQAEEVKAREAIQTAEKIAEAERIKKVEVLEAETNAEKAAVEIKVAAEAEKQAAQDRAEAVKIVAQSEADALMLKTDAKERDYAVEAEGKLKLNEADNAISDEQRQLLVKQQLINVLPNLVSESAKNLANIDSIKVVDMAGFNGVGSTTVEGEVVGSTSLADQVVNAAAKHQVQKPLIDSLMSEVGLNSDKSVSDAVSAMVTQNITQN